MGRLRSRGYWILCFTKHFNDWELDVVRIFFSTLLVKTVRRKENDEVI